MENKTTHTPAPWNIQERPEWIDVCWLGDRIVSIDKDDEQHAMGDALLIAAAPCMLALLKGFYNVYQERPVELSDKDIPSWIIEKLLPKVWEAQALIRKATGDE